MSCNSCSNVTLPGVAGPAGPQGPAGANGTNGINGTNGSDGADGADGTDGAVLLKSIGAESADYTSNTYGPPVISTGDGFPWTVTANTLSTDLDTLRLEGLVLATEGDGVKDLRIQIGTNTINAGIASYPMSMQFTIIGYYFKIDIVRVSNADVNIESETKMIVNQSNFGSFNYANAEIPGLDFYEVRKNGQSVGSLNLTSSDFSVSVDVRTANAAQPIKLVNCKLLKFKKV